MYSFFFQTACTANFLCQFSRFASCSFLYLLSFILPFILYFAVNSANLLHAHFFTFYLLFLLYFPFYFFYIFYFIFLCQFSRFASCSCSFLYLLFVLRTLFFNIHFLPLLFLTQIYAKSITVLRVELFPTCQLKGIMHRNNATV